MDIVGTFRSSLRMRANTIGTCLFYTLKKLPTENDFFALGSKMLLAVILVAIGLCSAQAKFNFTAYCQVCIDDSTCECYQKYNRIYCNGRDQAYEFPSVLKSIAYCMETDIDVKDFDITISQYKFSSIPANALRFTSTNAISLSLVYNNQLKTIDPNAFNGIKAECKYFRIGNTMMNEIPIQAIRSLRFTKSTCVDIYLEENKFTDLIELPRLLEHAGPNFCTISLFWNQIEKVPADAFRNIIAKNMIDLSSNRISTIASGAFKNAIVGALYLSGQEISSIADDAFEQFSANIFDLFLAGNKSYSVEMLKDLRSESISFGCCHWDVHFYYDAQRWLCFETAPSFCAKNIQLTNYCADVLKQLDCPEQISLRILLHLYDNDLKEWLNFTNLGVIESPGNFTSISLHTGDSGNFKYGFCFDASNLSADTFTFNVGVCEASLLSISQIAKHVSYKYLSYTTGYRYIPRVFLAFPYLQSLQLPETTIDCTCGLAKLFFNFVQRVQLTASCTDGTDVAAWIRANYKCCSDSNETVEEEYDLLVCRQGCGVANWTIIEENIVHSSNMVGN